MNSRIVCFVGYQSIPPFGLVLFLVLAFVVAIFVAIPSILSLARANQAAQVFLISLDERLQRVSER